MELLKTEYSEGDEHRWREDGDEKRPDEEQRKEGRKKRKRSKSRDRHHRSQSEKEERREHRKEKKQHKSKSSERDPSSKSVEKEHKKHKKDRKNREKKHHKSHKKDRDQSPSLRRIKEEQEEGRDREERHHTSERERERHHRRREDSEDRNGEKRRKHEETESGFDVLERLVSCSTLRRTFPKKNSVKRPTGHRPVYPPYDPPPLKHWQTVEGFMSRTPPDPNRPESEEREYVPLFGPNPGPWPQHGGCPGQQWKLPGSRKLPVPNSDNDEKKDIKWNIKLSPR